LLIVETGIDLIPKLTVFTLLKSIANKEERENNSSIDKIENKDLKVIIEQALKKSTKMLFINSLSLIIIFSPISILVGFLYILKYFYLKVKFYNFRRRLMKLILVLRADIENIDSISNKEERIRIEKIYENIKYIETEYCHDFFIDEVLIERLREIMNDIDALSDILASEDSTNRESQKGMKPIRELFKMNEETTKSCNHYFYEKAKKSVIFNMPN